MNMNSCLETTYQQAKEGFFLVYSAFLWVPLGILALQKSRTSLHSTVVPDRVLLPCSGVFNTVTHFTRKLEITSYFIIMLCLNHKQSFLIVSWNLLNIHT